MIKAILFDWHGVLDKRTFAGMLELITKNKEEIYTAGFEYAAGRMTPETFWSLIEEKSAQDYILQVERNEAIWSQLLKLKDKYELVILSDCPQDKKEVIQKTDLSFFDNAYFSCDYKLLKSDSGFFKIALDRLNLSAQECLFVDDSSKNIDYARKLGFKTLHYNGSFDLENL